MNVAGTSVSGQIGETVRGTPSNIDRQQIGYIVEEDSRPDFSAASRVAKESCVFIARQQAGAGFALKIERDDCRLGDSPKNGQSGENCSEGARDVHNRSVCCG